MPFVWLIERPMGGLVFKENGSFTEKRQADAQIFDTEEEAVATLEKARQAILAKKEAHKQKTGAKDINGSAKGRVFGAQSSLERHDSVLLKLNIKLNRLERTRLLEIQKTNPQLKTLWAVVVEDGQWLEVRSGMCALTRKADDATFFESAEQATDMAFDGAWTLAAETLAGSANVVELEVRIKTAKAAFPVRKGASGVNAFAGAWMAEQERDDLATEIKSQKTASKNKKAIDLSASNISDTGTVGSESGREESDGVDSNVKKRSRRL